MRPSNTHNLPCLVPRPPAPRPPRPRAPGPGPLLLLLLLLGPMSAAEGSSSYSPSPPPPTPAASWPKRGAAWPGRRPLVVGPSSPSMSATPSAPGPTRSSKLSSYSSSYSYCASCAKLLFSARSPLLTASSTLPVRRWTEAAPCRPPRPRPVAAAMTLGSGTREMAAEEGCPPPLAAASAARPDQVRPPAAEAGCCVR
jgi:hypothetical protein